jgi:hypothetical protein
VWRNQPPADCPGWPLEPDEPLLDEELLLPDWPL